MIEAVDELDLTAFYADYRSDGHGRAAHDPQMMVGLLLYAYAIGERSARGIERRLREDVAFRVIAANQAPDHATIARFRVRHQDALGELFGELLGLCERAGLVSAGVVAIDSTKIAAAASGHANRSYEQIAAEILDEAARTDAAEDEIYGTARGDELPPELCDRESRREWLRKATEDLQAERTTRSSKLAPTRQARLAEAKRRLEEEHALELRAEHGREAWRHARQTERAAAGKRMAGRPPKPKAPPSEPAGRVNVTDPDSSPVRTHRGFIQGYNAQAVATEDQIIVAAEITPGSADGGQLEPMLEAARAQLERAGASGEEPEVVLADTGYWSMRQIERLEEQGIQALVPPAKSKRAGPYAKMRRALATEGGAKLYRRRQTIIEPVFAQTKVLRGADRFQRRGLAACRAEWRLIAATHNLLKLHRHGLRTRTA